MTNVIDLPTNEEYLRACGDCGCVTFKFSVKGVASCAACGMVMTEESPWIAEVTVKEANVINGKDVHAITDMQDTLSAFKRVCNRAIERFDTIAFLLYATSDGNISWWATNDLIHNSEREAWVRQRLELMIEKEKQNGQGN